MHNKHFINKGAEIIFTHTIMCSLFNYDALKNIWSHVSLPHS